MNIIVAGIGGVDSKEKINGYFPSNLVLDGCVYIISRLKQAGVVENSGNIQSLYFGLDNYCNDKMLAFDTLFKEAQIDATLSQRISNIIWEKFIFLSPIATATSYYDKCIGEIISNDETLETTKLLIEEVIQLAKAMNITVADDITEKTLNKYKSLSFETTSSMHNDFRLKKSQTELQTLTGYVLSEGKKQNCAALTYSKLFAALEKKTTYSRQPAFNRAK
jgi:2-dehydropantoate 2-reductase